MKTLKIYITLCFVALAILTQAQLKKANTAFMHHHYEDAIELYNQVVKRDLDNTEAITNLAFSYWKTEQYSLAEYWFTRAALMNDDPKVKMWYGQLLIANEKYSEAAKWLEKYATAETDPIASKNARQMAAYCLAIGVGMPGADDYEVLPVEFNSLDLEFCPTLYKDKLLFTSNRPEAAKRGGEDDPWTSDRFTDVFMVTRTGDKNFSKAELFASEIASPYHEGPLCFSNDGKTMYLTRSDFNEKKRKFDELRNTRLKIVEMNLDESGHWIHSKDLEFCSSEYNCSHPAVTPDGKYLLFASDMPGGYGGMDLYKCAKTAEGVWGMPMNLGQHINTQGNELFPTVHSDGSLYFSSDLHVGYGGLDLYKCEQDGDSWVVPENLGAPINSSKDDFGICIDADGESGFFSSNRNIESKDDVLFFRITSKVILEGTVVDCSTREPLPTAQLKLSGDDYYSDMAFTNEKGEFKMSLPLNSSYELLAAMQGYISTDACNSDELISTEGLNAGDRLRVTLALSPKDIIDLSEMYLCGTVRNAKYGNPIGDCEISLLNRCNGEESTATTDETGTYYLSVQKGCEYEMSTSKNKFENLFRVFTAQTKEDCMLLDFELTFIETEEPPLLSEDVIIRKGMVLELFHIYFDLDKYKVREDAIPDLQTLKNILDKYPSMKGEVMAHTDSRASNDYNKTLSQNRAEAARAWLISQGVSADRLTAAGYGETRLKNHCKDNVECSELEHQRNRRVEFRVTDFDNSIDNVSRESETYVPGK